MRSFHKHPLNERNPKKRFGSLIGRSATDTVSAILFGIVFVTSSNFVFASDSSQSPSARTVPRTQASASAYETTRLPISNLNLILTGTIIGTPERALIREGNRKEELFAVGQAIASGVILTDVYRYGAIIRRDGVLEKLVLRSGAESQDPAHIQSDLPTLPSQPLPDEADRDKGISSFFVQYEFANKLFEAPDILSQAKIIPVLNGGMQISDIVPGSLFERLGLNDGDAIHTINGKQVSSVSDFVDLFQQRNNTDRLQVGVMRSGNIYNIQFDPEHGIEIAMVSEFAK